MTLAYVHCTAYVYVSVNRLRTVNSQELESRIVDQLEGSLRDAGLRFRLRHPRQPGPDLVLHLEAGGRRRVPVVLEVCANPRLAPVLHAAAKALSYSKVLGAIPAVALPSIGPGLREALKSQSVGYVSLDGQAYLAGEGILIDRRVPSLKPPLERLQSSSLFADKSSLLLRYLLSRASAPVRIRDLAEQLGISAGLVSRIVAHLRKDGYVVLENDLARISDRAALLDDWLEFYRRRAKRQREMRFYMHARDAASVLERLSRVEGRPDLPRWGLSVHAGASLVESYAFFSEVHVLVSGRVWEDAAEALRGHFGLELASREANVVLVRPYYDRSWHHGLRMIDGLPVVSDVQLFLDLSVYPRRGPEQAARIRERILSPQGRQAAL